MSVPDFQTLMLPFLKITIDGQEHSIASISAKMAEIFELTEEDIAELLPSGRQTRFRNRVNWVATILSVCRQSVGKTRLGLVLSVNLPVAC